MKVKLLRQVRNRYEIIRVDQLAGHESDFLKKAGAIHGLPFYVANDPIDKYRSTVSFELLNDAKKRILEWINYDYGRKYKRKNGKQIKVWALTK